MIEILNKIISFSKKNKIYDGVSFEDLKHLELKTGYMLPKGFEELYRTTNGGKLFNAELLEMLDIINFHYVKELSLWLRKLVKLILMVN